MCVKAMLHETTRKNNLRFLHIECTHTFNGEVLLSGFHVQDLFNVLFRCCSFCFFTVFSVFIFFSPSSGLFPPQCGCGCGLTDSFGWFSTVLNMVRLSDIIVVNHAILINRNKWYCSYIIYSNNRSG